MTRIRIDDDTEATCAGGMWTGNDESLVALLNAEAAYYAPGPEHGDASAYLAHMAVEDHDAVVVEQSDLGVEMDGEVH